MAELVRSNWHSKKSGYTSRQVDMIFDGLIEGGQAGGR